MIALTIGLLVLAALLILRLGYVADERPYDYEVDGL